jgi:2-polyprenyl-3-methyl-5-hydroxy-6-metoxy-1,4-benzoquinol methylase
MKYRCVQSIFGYSASPLPSSAELNDYYRNAYYQSPQGQYQKSYDEEEKQYFDDRAQIALDFAAANGASGGAVLDLGCGEGFFLRSAAARGFDIFGIDHSLYGLEQQNPTLLAHGHFQAADVTAPGGFAGKTFELVYCKNVLEHVLDPSVVLQRIGEYLLPDGIAIIEVPNDFSDLHNLLFGTTPKEATPIFCPPEHLHYFSTKTLSGIATRAGYSILDSFSDYPIDHLLLEDRFNYYDHKDFGKAAHSLRRKFLRYLATIERSQRLSLLRSFYEAGLGRAICLVISKR